MGLVNRLAAGVLFLGVSSGCATPRTTLMGVLYHNTVEPVTASGGSAGNRVGEACQESFFGLVAKGDASIETARIKGGITTISSVDTKVKNFVGLYSSLCTVVRGR